jgi:hypothetical protein
MRRVLIAAVIVAMAQGVALTARSQFYIVSVSFSDYGAAFYYRLIEVKPSGPGSLVRDTRIATVNFNCPRMVVQSAEVSVRNTPAELASAGNPCAIKPRDLGAAVKKYRRKASVFEATSFGIVAQCDSSEVTLTLPVKEELDLDRLREAHPEMARLWNLASAIVDSAFGPNDIFHDRTEADDIALQRAGENMAPELISGRYDAGLAGLYSEP